MIQSCMNIRGQGIEAERVCGGVMGLQILWSMCSHFFLFYVINVHNFSFCPYTFTVNSTQCCLRCFGEYSFTHNVTYADHPSFMMFETEVVANIFHIVSGH